MNESSTKDTNKSNMMIRITKSPTADTRTCDFTNVKKEELLASSSTHIGDVVRAMMFFVEKITEASAEHDWDKLVAIDWFHEDFLTGFQNTNWLENHCRISRHHLSRQDGIPTDVNLIDVLEYIADCVVAGMARSGNSFYSPVISTELLERAFNNTVELLKNQVEVIEK